MAQEGGNGAGQTIVSPPVPTDPLVGQVLDGRYRIERVLGEGGMGIVYKAIHTTLGKPLAVKVLRAEVSRDEQIVARFKQEAQSASAIGNQHIIDISDFGSLPDGSTYFVMEYLTGQSLTDAMEAGKLETSRTIHIAKQLCHALGSAHEIGIVHRDLKPDNIQLVQRGSDHDFVKVLDFGIAKVGGGNSKLTQAGQVFGTPHYMSPEQCAGTNVDQRTDIYALGIILYEMGTGKVPFDADNLMGILTKHLYENPIPPHELPPPQDVPPALEAVIMKALAKAPEARYQTMAELASDLDAIASGLTPSAVMEQVDRGSAAAHRVQARTTTGLSIGVGEPQLPVKKSLVPLVAGIGLLLAVGGALAFAFGGKGEEQATPIQPTPETTAATSGTNPSDSAKLAAGEGVEADAVKAGAREPEAEAAKKEAPPAKVEVTSNPTGVDVYQDGALIGNTPFVLPKPSSGESLELQLRAPGYKNQTIRISSLTAAAVKVTLEKEPAKEVKAEPKPSRRRAARPTPTKAPAEAPKPARRPSLGPGSEVLDPWQ